MSQDDFKKRIRRVGDQQKTLSNFATDENAGKKGSVPRPLWLTIILFLTLSMIAFLVLRPYALELFANRRMADGVLGGVSALVTWPVAGFVVRSIFRQ